MPRTPQRFITSLAILFLFGCASSPRRPANAPPVINSPPVIQGGLTHTGHPLDVAIQGLGFFPVILPNGQIGYTRVGKLFVDDSGRLVVRAGQDYPLSPPISIRPGATNITIYMEGAVTCTFPGHTSDTDLGQLKLALFSNPAGLEPFNSDPVYIATKNSGPPMITNPGEACAGQIMQTYLEGAYHGP